MFDGCYVIDRKEGKKKKSGDWFGYVTLLYCDPQKFNQPVLENVWFSSALALESAMDGVRIGDAVTVKRVIGGGDPEFYPNERFESIDFSPVDG